MKLHLRILASLLVLAVVGSADAAQRIVLYEHFTNASCPPCAAANPAHRAMISALGPDTVMGVSYHVWWPGVDPMYNLNTSEVQTRTNYYAVNGVPHSRVDGTQSFTPSSGNASTVRNAIRTRYAVQSPCTIDISGFVAGETSIGFSGTVHAEQNMLDDNTRLFVALITDTVQYQSPPGTNGETLFEHVFRDFGTAATGLAFTLNAGEDFEFEGTLNRNAAWDPADLEVICFITNYSTRAAYQAAVVEVNQFYGANLATSDPHQTITDSQAERVYTLSLESVGTNEDTYTVTLGGTLPTGWTRSIEAPGVPGDADSIYVTLPGHDWTGLTLHVNPNGYPGSANVSVAVRSHNWPTLDLRDDFTTFADPEILLVDDDGGADYETYYTDAITAAEENLSRTFAWGVWDYSRDALDGDFGNVDMIIWDCGEDVPGSSLNATDMVLLADYLDAGGRLFLTGQKIGIDLRSESFYTNYLHATYRGNRLLAEVSGISGDLIGDNLTFRISDNLPGNVDQTSQHWFNVLEGAVPSFIFTGTDNTCGLHVETANYKLIYLGFGFEGIDSDNDREALMTNAIDWLLDPTAVDPREGTLPAAYALEQNFPNPFNPETVIPYSLPERADVKLTVFDLTGRAVTTLVDGPQNAGHHNVSFNGAELSSGVYFYRIETPNFNSTRKLVLMK
jgi:hypothetical protein